MLPLWSTIKDLLNHSLPQCLMGISLLLLGVWMKSPCCSAIRTGHSPVTLSQWLFMIFSMQWATATQLQNCQTITLYLTSTFIQSQIIWIIILLWSFSKPETSETILTSVELRTQVSWTMKTVKWESNVAYTWCILIQRRRSDGSTGGWGLFHRSIQKQLFYL